MVAAWVTSRCDNSHPWNEYRNAQAKIPCNLFTYLVTRYVLVQSGKSAQRNNLGNHPWRRIWVIIWLLKMYYEILMAGLYLLVISAKVLLNLSAWAKREGLVIQNTSPVSVHTMFVIVLRTATSIIRSIWSKTSWRNSLSNSYRLTDCLRCFHFCIYVSIWEL